MLKTNEILDLLPKKILICDDFKERIRNYPKKVLESPEDLKQLIGRADWLGWGIYILFGSKEANKYSELLGNIIISLYSYSPNKRYSTQMKELINRSEFDATVIQVWKKLLKNKGK